MSNDTHIDYHPLPDATPEAELGALAAVYSFLMQRHANRTAAELGGEDKEKGGEQDHKPGSLRVAEPRPTVRSGIDGGEEKRS